MTINVVALKERIAIANLPGQDLKLAPDERDFLLKAINVYADIHAAKRAGARDQTVYGRLAWALLDDNVPPDMLSDIGRRYVAGLIAGALYEFEKITREQVKKETSNGKS